MNEFLKKRARISRTGIYEYAASEVPGTPPGTPPNAIVRVYRSEDEVFAKDSLSSFENLPLTIGHPKDGVTPKNAKGLIHGVTTAPVIPDSKGPLVDVVLMSDEAQCEYREGRRQLSAGYQMTFKWKSGKTKDGQVYDAEQSEIRGNHIALVKAGRAGTAEILDEENKSMDKELHDMLQKQIADVKASLDAMTKDRDTLAGQVTALKAAQLSDEQLQAKIEDGVKQRFEALAAKEGVLAKAKKFAPALTGDGKTIREIQEAAIKTRMPGLTLDKESPEYVSGVFDSMVAVTTASTNNKPSMRANMPAGGMSHDERRRLTGMGA